METMMLKNKKRNEEQKRTADEEILKRIEEIIKIGGGNKISENNPFIKTEVWEKFKNYRLLNSAEKTKVAYRKFLFNFFKFTAPDSDKITVADFRKILNYFTAHNWSQNSKRQKWYLMKNFLSFLFEEGYTNNNLSKKVRAPKKAKTVAFVPTDEHIKEFFTAALGLNWLEKSKNRYFPVFKFYVKTGFRLRELVDLNVKDVDFGNNRIIVRDTKSGGDATFPMDNELRNLLKVHIETLSLKSGSLFIGNDDKRIHVNTICNNLKKIIKKAELPDEFTVHSMRHYFIDKLRRSGVDVSVIQKLARHQDINTTLSYCRVREEEMIEGVSKINLSNI